MVHGHHNHQYNHRHQPFREQAADLYLYHHRQHHDFNKITITVIIFCKWIALQQIHHFRGCVYYIFSHCQTLSSLTIDNKLTAQRCDNYLQSETMTELTGVGAR